MSDEVYLQHILGDTCCIVTPAGRIPCYIPEKHTAILMDSGIYSYADAIIRTVEQANLRVLAILTSHAHIDHLGTHRYFQENHGAKIHMTPLDAAVCSNPLAHLAGDNISYEGAKKYASMISVRYDRIIDRSLTAVDVDGISFPMIALDGHAPEHTGFVTPDDVAYLADTLLSRDVMSALKLPYVVCCEEDLNAKEKTRHLHHSCYILAHNSVETDIRQLAQDNIDSMLRKIHAVLPFAAEPSTAEQIITAYETSIGTVHNKGAKASTGAQIIKFYIGYLLDRGMLQATLIDGIQYYQAV